MSELCLSLKLLNDSIFVLPAAIYLLLHGFSWTRTAVAPSLSHGPRTWNSFRDNLREPDLHISYFRRTLKTSVNDTEHIGALELVLRVMAP